MMPIIPDKSYDPFDEGTTEPPQEMDLQRCVSMSLADGQTMIYDHLNPNAWIRSTVAVLIEEIP